ncbi:hypothetical protein RJT34_16080 [Clitoria ternatea]|uniref:Beta-glucosidase n=1 Tax=Clitoria ternatea TaxID=43366 RepID=A0AAN9J6J6_CLITE
MVLLSYSQVESRGTSPHVFARGSFPSNFLFGVGTSALQVEGSNNGGGRGPSVWDAIVENDNGTIQDIDKFPTMIDHYHRYKEDVALLKRLGINSYRFSICWSRIMPGGTMEAGINQEGIDFYNNLIDELLANDIIPFVTILHFDYPLSLLDLGGFLNPVIVDLYKDYCELLFTTFGDRVKHWTTFNEPEITAVFNYMHGFDNNKPEPCQITKECKQAYIVMHNFIISHATAVKLYREEFKAIQRGEIGIVIALENYIPYSFKLEDIAAADRLMDFFTGWMLDPITYGDYPDSMKELVKDRLPAFTEGEKALIQGSTDFIGINYYRSFYARHEPNKTLITGFDNFDALAVREVINENGQTLGYLENATKSFVYPEGLYNALIYIKLKYQNPKIYITENGISSGNIKNPLKDRHRKEYIAQHLNVTKYVIEAGVNVQGYFVWAAFDTFEFHQGFSERLGLIYIDFNDNLNRVEKQSARWYRWFLTGNKGI